MTMDSATLTHRRAPPASRPQPEIMAGALRLRPLDRWDLPLIAANAGDRRVAEGARSIPHPFPPEAAEAFLAAALDPAREEDVWAIDGAQSGLPRFLGVISLKELDPGTGRRQSQIGLWVAPAHWHGGIASAAVKALLEANPHDNRTVFAELFQDNPASARVLTNAGFDYIGDAEAFCLARGTTVPTWTYLRRMG